MNTALTFSQAVTYKEDLTLEEAVNAFALLFAPDRSWIFKEDLDEPDDLRQQATALEWLDRQPKEMRNSVLSAPGILGRIAERMSATEDRPFAVEKIIRWLDEATLDERIKMFSCDDAMAYITYLYDDNRDSLAARIPGWLNGATAEQLIEVLSYSHAERSLTEAEVFFVPQSPPASAGKLTLKSTPL